MMSVTERKTVCNRFGMLRFAGLALLLSALLSASPVAAARQVNIGVLMVAQTRAEAVEGFRQAMAEHAATTGGNMIFDLRDAQGDLARLDSLAADMVAGRPDLLVAAGGLEADALARATTGTHLPVVFLGVSSAVERGLVASLQAPGGNLTGVDTNDTVLVEKRLWFIGKLFPEARRVLAFNVPGITPSEQSVAIARRSAPQFGLDLTVIDVASSEEIATAAARLTRADADVLLLLPAAPIDRAVREALLPLSRRERIPVFGYNEESMERGAVVAYGSSRRECGAQAAAMAVKILHGTPPSQIPVETPARLALTVNRRLLDELGVKLTGRAWRLADKVNDLHP